MEGLKDSAAGKNRIYVDSERIAELCELARNNGKLGGRPPKEITQARRLLEQLEEIDFSINQKLTDEQKKN